MTLSLRFKRACLACIVAKQSIEKVTYLCHKRNIMEKLFLGISSHVVCLSKKTGEQLWKTKLKSSSITNVYFEDDKVFAYSGGHLFCLNATDGVIIWENTLKGFGYGTCIIASEQQASSVISSQVAAQQAIAATTVAATTSSAN